MTSPAMARGPPLLFWRGRYASLSNRAHRI
jgi:hypothetical protein